MRPPVAMPLAEMMMVGYLRSLSATDSARDLSKCTSGGENAASRAP